MSTNKRIRGRSLQQIRARTLRAQPLCVHCLARGITTAATVLDHIVAITNKGTDEDSNRQALCDACHEAKTRIDLGQKHRIAFDANGNPLSPLPGW